MIVTCKLRLRLLEPADRWCVATLVLAANGLSSPLLRIECEEFTAEVDREELYNALAALARGGVE